MKFRPTLYPTLLLLSPSPPASARKYFPASSILEQKNDAQQVLLIQVTDDGVSTPADVLQSECGTDTYYITSAVVLGVNRTVEPDATALGAQTVGRVMERCGTLKFKTFERQWIDDECEAFADPGRKTGGTCGYVYLTPGMEASEPYRLAVTGEEGFEEVDGCWCEAAARRHCPEYAKEDEGGSEPASGGCQGGVAGSATGATPEGGEGDAGGEGDEGGEGGAGVPGLEGGEGDEGESPENGAAHSHLVRSALIGLLSAVAYWRIGY